MPQHHACHFRERWNSSKGFISPAGAPFDCVRKLTLAVGLHDTNVRLRTGGDGAKAERVNFHLPMLPHGVDLGATMESAGKIAVAPAHDAAHDAATARLLERVWLVCVEGSDPIGPVSADQLARGFRAGKVPSDALAKHESDVFWSDLLDIPDFVVALKAVSAESEPPPQSRVAPSLAIRQYLVWTKGGDPVGPVSADQIARGIRAGKVPTDASIQKVGDLFAEDVLDAPDVIAALKAL